MCSELVHCGNASSQSSGLWDCRAFSPCSLDVQTNRAPCADGDKRQAYGRGEEESGGSRSDVGKVESPGDPPGTTTRKRNVRFTGFSVLLGNKEALTHSHTVQVSHTFTGKEWSNHQQVDFALFYHSWENKLMDFTHIQTRAVAQFLENLSGTADALQAYENANALKRTFTQTHK